MTRDMDGTTGGSAAGAEVAKSAAPGKVARMEGQSPEYGMVIVNVRFLPNGLVNSITYLPESMTPQAWFDFLCHAAPQTYRPLSGGRGTFTIERDDFAAICGRLAQ